MCRFPGGLLWGTCPGRHCQGGLCVCVCGAARDEVSCCLEHLCLPGCPRSDERGQRCQILLAAYEIRAPTKLRGQQPRSLPAGDRSGPEKGSQVWPLGNSVRGAARDSPVPQFLSSARGRWWWAVTCGGTGTPGVAADPWSTL